MTLDLSKMTFGYELELGDIVRSRALPEWMGAWEYAETDIVNIYGTHKGKACDPLGMHPPVGGEINILPAPDPFALANRVSRSIDWFREQGDKPSASCVNHGHVHVRVPGLRDDIEALKRLTAYIKRNQQATIAACYGYAEHPRMGETKTARTYLKWDGGRPMPDWMADNITTMAEDFDDFIRIQCCGKDGVSRGRPFRHAINTYCLKHIDTIEFRCFRASLRDKEIYNSIRFAKRFLTAALEGGPDVPEILAQEAWRFPEFRYNHDHYQAWEATKWGKERGTKVRTLVE